MEDGTGTKMEVLHQTDALRIQYLHKLYYFIAINMVIEKIDNVLSLFHQNTIFDGATYSYVNTIDV